MDNIGGYFAELKLITDGKSFDEGKKSLNGISVEGTKAVAVLDKLKASTGNKSGYASYGGYMHHFRGGGGGGSPPTSSSGSAYLPDPGGDSETKSDKKKEAITRVATLYALVKAYQVVEKLVKVIGSTAFNAAAYTQASMTTSARAGLSMGDFQQWMGAGKATGNDAAALIADATALNDVFRNTLLGNKEAAAKFGALAVPLSQLGLDPFKMLNEKDPNKNILALLNKAGTTRDPSKLALLSQFGSSFAGFGAYGQRSHLTGSAMFALGEPNRGVVSRTDELNAVQAGQFKEMTDLITKLFGNAALGGMVESLRKANEAMQDPKFQANIKELGEDMGKFVGHIADIAVTLAKLDPGKGRASLWPGGPTWAWSDLKIKDDTPSAGISRNLQPITINQTIVGMPSNIVDKLNWATRDAINKSKITGVGGGKPLGAK